MISRVIVLVIPLALILAGCGGLALRPADFSWPVESVLKVDSKGTVEDERYSMTLNVKPLLFAETGDSVNVSKHSLRVIRDRDGFYYIAAVGFKNVYVFVSSEGSLSKQNVIPVSEKGLESPAFNQRPPYVQLINAKDKGRLLNKDGIQEGGKK
jgi:hypothetical protein